MAADFDKPTAADIYTDVLPQLRDNIDLTATMFASGAGLNTPLGAVQFLGGNFSVWNGATFNIQTISVGGGGTGSTTAAGARNNLDVYSKSEASDTFLDESSNLSDVADAATSFNNIKQAATTTSSGAVEEATAAEMTAGTNSKFPDCSTVKAFTDATYLNESSNLSDVASALTSFNNIKQNATTSFAGVVEEATTAEMAAGSNSKFPDAATIQTVLGLAVKSTNGYWKDRNTGFILQWGKDTYPNTSFRAVTFPIAFPSAVRYVGVQIESSTSTAGTTLRPGFTTTSGFQSFTFNNPTGRDYYWVAVGY